MTLTILECKVLITFSLTLLLAVVDCGDLSAPANGNVSFTNGTTFGSEAAYTCSSIDGYRLVGNATQVCQANGNWSGSQSACVQCDMGYEVVENMCGK